MNRTMQLNGRGKLMAICVLAFLLLALLVSCVEEGPDTETTAAETTAGHVTTPADTTAAGSEDTTVLSPVDTTVQDPADTTAAEPETTEPAVTEPAEPGTTEPAVTEPAEPGTTEPAVTEPAEPGTTEPAVTEPAEPGTTEPAEPETTEPAVTEPAEPGTTEPAVTEPVEPETSKPEDTEPVDPDTPDVPFDQLPTAEDKLDRVWSILAGDLAKLDNYKTVYDLNLAASADRLPGLSFDFPYDVTILQAGVNTSIVGDSITQPVSMIYVDGVLYTVLDGEKIQCEMTPDEFAAVANAPLVGKDLAKMPEGIGLSELFSSLQLIANNATGNLAFKAKGFAPEMIDTAAPILLPFLQSSGLVGVDDSGRPVTDPVALLNQAKAVLRSLDEDHFSITFRTSAEGKLYAIEIDATSAVRVVQGGLNLPGKVHMTGTITGEWSGQTITAPADADSYTRKNASDIFGE